MHDNITLYDIKKILGEPTGKQGGEYVWQCPYCMDSHKDNMRFNERKGLLWCFADPEHSKEVLKKMNKNDRPVQRTSVSEVPKWEIMQEKYIEYMVQCQEELLNNQELLDYVYKKRGLSKKVIDWVGLGFDSEANQFVIPIFGLKEGCAITDFELRAYGDKKIISRVGGGHNTVAMIYGAAKAKTLIFCEGFMDGYALLQFMLDKKQTDFTIYSCSHGAESLLKCLPSVNFSNFEEVKLMLDNDEAGDKATKSIIEQYPFIKDSRKFLVDSGCKDVGEFLLCQALFS